MGAKCIDLSLALRVRMGVEEEGFYFQLLDEKSTVYKGHNSSSVAKLKVYYQTCMNVMKIEADGTGPMMKVLD